jgi:hypothetical protein
MNLPTGLLITVEDWEKTPASVQTVIVMVWQDNQTLKEQVNKLQERVNKNSPNLVQTAFERPAAKAKLSQARAEWGEKRWAKRASRAWSEAERGRRSE